MDWYHECYLYSNCLPSRVVPFLGGLLMATDNCLAFHASTFYSINTSTLEREGKLFHDLHICIYLVSLNILNKPVLRIKKKILSPNFQ